MLNLYIYLILQFLIILCIYYGLNLTIRNAPAKIKVLSIIVLGIFLVRSVSLLILFLSQSMIKLYLLKFFVFLNMIGVPIGAVICLYIFLRNDRLNFTYSFMFGAILLAVYIIVMLKIPCGVQTSDKFGYYISLLKPLPVAFAYLAMNSIIIVICILAIGKPGVNNLGLYLALLAGSVSIAETLLSLIGIELLAHNIIGDACWVALLDFSIMKLKR